MNLSQFKDEIVIDHVPNPTDGHIKFLWETVKFSEHLNISQVSLNNEYKPQEKDKLYFFPGCDVPRHKVREWGKKHKISVTIKEENATAKFAGSTSLRECIETPYCVKIDRKIFLNWLDHNYDLGSGNIAVLYKEISESQNNNVFLSGRYYGYSGRNVTGISGKESDVTSFGFKKSIKAMDPNTDCHYSGVTSVCKNRWSDLKSLCTDSNIYSQESIIGLINETAIVIDKKLYEELNTMFQTSNYDDKVMALEIIANCNIDLSLHYLLLLLEKFGNTIYGMKEKSHVNFKSLLEYLKLGSHWTSIDSDDIIGCLLDKKVLTMETLKEYSEEVKKQWKEQTDTKYFNISKITVSDEIKNYFLDQLKIPEQQSKTEENDRQNKDQDE